MLTRCPTCATHFRVTPAQLKARTGSVRCGECQHVFNALDSLIEEPMVIVAQRVPEPSQESVSPPLSGTEIQAAEYSEPPADQVAVPPAPTSEPPPEVPDELSALPPEAQEPSTLEPAEAPEPEPAEPEPAEPELPEPVTVTEVEARDENWSETFPEPPPPPRRWPWLIGSALALTAIGLQAVLAFRVELAVIWPEVKPALVALCDITGCEVGLPTKPGLVGIEASDLHPDSEHKGRLALMATLKNRAPFAQQFPHLELTLTDTADQAIARKVLAPADYLRPAISIANGMQPNADIAIAIGVDAGEMAASGYRLYLFYP